LKDVWFARKKKKNCVKRGCRCKNVDAYETNEHYRRILVSLLRTNADTIYDVYLSNLRNTYKVKDNIEIAVFEFEPTANKARVVPISVPPATLEGEDGRRGTRVDELC
jgi:hypothetical protein